MLINSDTQHLNRPDCSWQCPETCEEIIWKACGKIPQETEEPRYIDSEERRQWGREIEVYKVLSRMYEANSRHGLLQSDSKDTRGTSEKLIVLKARKEVENQSFMVAIVGNLDSLPIKIVKNPTLKAFKLRRNRRFDIKIVTWWSWTNTYELADEAHACNQNTWHDVIWTEIEPIKTIEAESKGKIMQQLKETKTIRVKRYLDVTRDFK